MWERVELWQTSPTTKSIIPSSSPSSITSSFTSVKKEDLLISRPSFLTSLSHYHRIPSTQSSSKKTTKPQSQTKKSDYILLQISTDTTYASCNICCCILLVSILKQIGCGKFYLTDKMFIHFILHHVFFKS